MTHVLGGDFGGTSARVALFEVGADGLPRLLEHDAYPSREVGGVAAAVRRFLAERRPPRVAAASFGVAGAVSRNHATLTNLGWEVDGGALARELGFPVELVNDLVATAMGMGALGPDDVLDLNPGAEHAPGNAVLVGPGTGLGVALIVWSGERMVAVASEGGHVELAARDEEEWALRQFLAPQCGGRVSVERVASGLGLRHLYDFHVARGELAPSEAVAAAIAAGENAGKVIAEAAMAGTCALCARVLDRMASVLGAFAGDMALVGGATGGVYLGGGVSVRLAPKLADGTFLRAFLAKGRLAPFVAKVPVQILLREDTALLGAGRRAAELAAGS